MTDTLQRHDNEVDQLIEILELFDAGPKCEARNHGPVWQAECSVVATASMNASCSPELATVLVCDNFQTMFAKHSATTKCGLCRDGGLVIDHWKVRPL